LETKHLERGILAGAHWGEPAKCTTGKKKHYQTQEKAVSQNLVRDNRDLKIWCLVPKDFYEVCNLETGHHETCQNQDTTVERNIME